MNGPLFSHCLRKVRSGTWNKNNYHVFTFQHGSADFRSAVLLRCVTYYPPNEIERRYVQEIQGLWSFFVSHLPVCVRLRTGKEEFVYFFPDILCFHQGGADEHCIYSCIYQSDNISSIFDPAFAHHYFVFWDVFFESHRC